MNNEQENLSRNDEKVRQILGSLEKVDAPSNFDFQLKSKIANTKSTRKRLEFWRYFAIGVPSLACLALVAFFAFNRNITPPQNNVAEVKEPQKIESLPINEVKPPEVPSIEVAVQTTPETTNFKKESKIIEPKIVEDKVIAKTDKPQNIELENKKILPKKPVVKDSFSGNITSASTDIPKPIVPKGLNGNSPNLKINETDTVFEIESLLNDLGIETTAESGKLKVKSVRKNSSAERSGIKNNDLIEAVDNQKIAPKETRKKSFDAKSINVIRDGKTLELKLQQ
jgi:PDZ domain